MLFTDNALVKSPRHPLPAPKPDPALHAHGASIRSVTDNAQFPLNAIFNHEPKKTSSREPADIFRNYLYMHMSRGAMLVEYYLKTSRLQASDWDALAETTKWPHEFTPAFARVRMHGSNPRMGEVYGYAGFSEGLAYVSFHNPAKTAQTYTLQLDRKLGAPTIPTQFALRSPIQGGLKGLPRCIMTGSAVTVMLTPAEIRLLELRPVTTPTQCNCASSIHSDRASRP